MTPRLHIITICYEAMPFITWHLPVFNRLVDIDWTWHCVEGPAKNIQCTSWCKRLKTGSSKDGTADYLNEISTHSNVQVYSKRMWNGKIEMVNAPVGHIAKGDYVMEIDVDEVWTARQIELAVRNLINTPSCNGSLFRCRYFVGPNLVITSQDCYGNHTAYEWRRLWRAGNDFRFTKHEPPDINEQVMYCSQDSTESIGLVFDHYAYFLKSQVAFKEHYYGYTGAVEKWEELNRCSIFPVDLGDYFVWAKKGVSVEKFKNS